MEKLKELLKKEIVQDIIAVTLAFLIAVSYVTLKFDGTYGYFTIETQEIKNCDSSSVTKYYSKGDVTIYLSCLSSVKIKDSIREIELKKYLSGSNSKFERRMNKILSVLHEAGVFYDGGSKEYDDYSLRTNNGISITKCNTLDGNHDIYIGPNGADLISHCK